MAKNTTAPTSRITFTITGYYDLDGLNIEEATCHLREAVDKIREMGSATCKARFPSDETEIG